MILGCVLLVAQTLLAMSAANSLKRLLLPNVDRCESALATVLGFLAVVQVCVLGCGLIGILHVWGVLGCVALLAGVLRFQSSCVGTSLHQSDIVPDASEADTVTGPSLRCWREFLCRLIHSFPMGVLVAGAVYWICRHGFGPTRLSWDDYAYHLTYPYLWLKDARITAEPLAFQSAFPFGAELFSLWWMLPLRLSSQSDVLAWVSLTGPIYGLLCGLAIVVILRSVRCSVASAIVPVVLVLTSRTILWEVDQFADVDFALPALMLAAMAFILRLNDNNERRAFLGRLTYAAMGSGLSLGTKFTALISCLIMLVVILRSATVGRRWNRLLPSLAIVSGAWIVLGCYWYARNWVVYGNPVWPARIPFFRGVDSIYQTSTLREYASLFGLQKAIADALMVYMDWPMTHAVLAAMGFIGVLLLWPCFRSPEAWQLRVWVGLSWGVLTLTVALLPTQPFSAGHEFTFASATVHVTSMRFVTLIPILGWISLGAVMDAALRRDWRAVVAAVISAYALAQLCICSEHLMWTVTLVTIAFAITLFEPLLMRMGKTLFSARFGPLSLANCRPNSPTPELSLVVSCLVLMIIWHPAKRDATHQSLTRPFDRDISAEWACLNDFPHGTIAGHAHVYILFGERFQFSPLLRGDARLPVDASHFVSSIPAFDGLPASEIEQSLKALRIELFVTTTYELHGRQIQSPLELQFERSGEFIPICRGSAMTVWRVRGANPLSTPSNLHPEPRP